ncbi:MAG: winged helix DNA-binding domain-containing protein [Roseiflexaceae bacterium]
MPTHPSAKATTARGGSGAGDLLSQRALNRALLARQHLLRRVEMPAADMIAHLVGIQAQAPYAPYIGLWTRLEGFQHAELAQLLTDRLAVRIALMRSTIHLVTARDCLALRPLIQPVLERGLNGTFGKRLAGLDIQALAAAGRALVEQQPRTFADLGALLLERWPGRDPLALANAVRALVPLVQIPPRGIWGAGGLATHTSAEAWLGRPLDPAPTPDEMILRYLAAFGPASVRDIQLWSGLTRLREATERLRPRLRSFRDEHGHELFDLPDAPRPDPETPAPPRFLPEFDNLLLSHADRTRVVSDEHRKRTMTINGVIPGSVLLDGLFYGQWTIKRQRGAATLIIDLFEPLPQQGRNALAEEGARLLAFAADAESHDIQFTVLPTSRSDRG